VDEGETRIPLGKTGRGPLERVSTEPVLTESVLTERVLTEWVLTERILTGQGLNEQVRPLAPEPVHRTSPPDPQ
jgi:hypothetical protein